MFAVGTPIADSAPAMGRPLRMLEPGCVWFVTARCSEARFFFSPDNRMSGLFGMWLARALERFNRIALHGAMMMSNHLHLIVTDDGSQLSAFMEFFLGRLAHDVNRYRKRRGQVLERRFDATPILDDEALITGIVYLVVNPVAENLVERHEDWPGVCLYPARDEAQEHSFSYFNDIAYERERRRAIAKKGPPPKVDDFQQKATLMIQPLRIDHPTDDVLASRLIAEIRCREALFADLRRSDGKRVLGAERASSIDPMSSPRNVKYKRRSICHTSSKGLLDRFREIMRSFRNAYSAASAAFRSGDQTAAFPLYSFPPRSPLVVPS